MLKFCPAKTSVELSAMILPAPLKVVAPPFAVIVELDTVIEDESFNTMALAVIVEFVIYAPDEEYIRKFLPVKSSVALSAISLLDLPRIGPYVPFAFRTAVDDPSPTFSQNEFLSPL